MPLTGQPGKAGACQVRRYQFKLYPTEAQAAELHAQRMLMADLWNALLQRYEDITRRTQQRQVWYEKCEAEERFRALDLAYSRALDEWIAARRDNSGSVVCERPEPPAALLAAREAWFRERRAYRRVGLSIHNPVWETVRKKRGERVRVEPVDGRPKSFTRIDMQNEVTWLANCSPEWRAMSIHCGHQVAKQLAAAIEAFYSRAGYPRYRARAKHGGIPHRFASGCVLIKEDRHQRSWWLRLKGVPGDIWARGEFPGQPEKLECCLIPREGEFPGQPEKLEYSKQQHQPSVLGKQEVSAAQCITKWTDADVLWRDGRWWVSVCVEIEPRRAAGRWPRVVRFDLIDCFATIDGVPSWLPEACGDLAMCRRTLGELEDYHAEQQRLLDWRRRSEAEYLRDREALSRLAAKIARRRRDMIHVWTSRLIESASDLTIYAPPVRESTRSPRGDERRWGAEVETVSGLNRAVLSQAPATAVRMLVYKAAEAGVRCDVVDAAPIKVGAELVAAGKATRRARRKVAEMV